MHRILNIASNENNNLDFVEQPEADCIYITSVKIDINILADLISSNKAGRIKNNIRAIHLSNIKSPSQIDHYFNKTIKNARIVILRLFGDRGTWSYGIEKLKAWADQNVNKKLIILSGTEDQDISLNELSSIDLDVSIKISKLLREGGKENYTNFLKILNLILKIKKLFPKNI